jgi:CheY-like chemotaxis protein
VDLKVGVEDADASQTTLRFEVNDTGVGIPACKHQSIFAAFSQADTSTTRKYGGTGLGLTISARLVQLMGGRIWVDSMPRQGSSFCFTAKFARARGPAGPACSDATPSLAGVPVLIVDGDDAGRLSLGETAVRWGMTATVSAGAREALQTLRQAAAAGAPLPLILYAAGAPDMDGISFAEAVAADRQLCVPKIVILGSRPGRGDEARSPELGIARWLAKPVKRSEIRETIKAALDPDRPPKPNPPLCQSPVGSRPALRVLIAEDNPVNQKVARGFVERRGHVVETVSNGMEAVQALERATFELVLMDVQMPEMDGYEATAEIRRREEDGRRRQTIIAMTAHAMKGDRERCLAAGMDGYLAKPIQAGEMTAALEKLEAALRSPSELSVPSSF